MVYERREEPTEAQIHRHAVSHLPTGADPVFQITDPDSASGLVPVIINGQVVWQTIQTVINNYTTTTSGGGLGVRYIPFGSDLSTGQSVAL